MRRRGWLAVTVCLVLFGMPAQKADAQIFGIGNATEWTQILNNVQLVMSYLKQAQTALNALQTAQMMVREGTQLIEHPSTNILADLSMLSNILVQSQGLAGDMASMDARFRQTYGTYNGPDAAVSFALKYNTWAGTTLNSIHGAMNAAGYQGNLLGNEQAWMTRIQTMNQTPMGRDQSLQLGNTIAIEEIAQLQKLRQLMIADMTSKAAIAAQATNTEQAQQLAQQSGFGPAHITADRRGW